jgi:hypothetical protein
MRQLDFGCGLAVIEVTMRLPIAQIELSLRSTMQACTIRAPTMRERAAHVRVPATEYSRHEIAYLCHISPLVRIALVCITRSHQPNWATKRHKSRKKGVSEVCDLCASLWLPFWLILTARAGD